MSTVSQRLDENWDEIIKMLRIEGTPNDKAWALKWLQKLVQFEYITPGEKRIQLDRFAKDAGRLVEGIEMMAPSLRKELGVTKRDVERLGKLRAKSRRLRPRTVVRSGNAQRTAAMKRQAADIGFRWVFECLTQMPTLTVGSPWLKIVEILVSIATGEESGAVYQACSDFLKELEEQGVFSEEDRKEWHKWDKKEPYKS